MSVVEAPRITFLACTFSISSPFLDEYYGIRRFLLTGPKMPSIFRKYVNFEWWWISISEPIGRLYDMSVIRNNNLVFFFFFCRFNFQATFWLWNAYCIRHFIHIVLCSNAQWFMRQTFPHFRSSVFIIPFLSTLRAGSAFIANSNSDNESNGKFVIDVCQINTQNIRFVLCLTSIACNCLLFIFHFRCAKCLDFRRLGIDQSRNLIETLYRINFYGRFRLCVDFRDEFVWAWVASASSSPRNASVFMTRYCHSMDTLCVSALFTLVWWIWQKLRNHEIRPNEIFPFITILSNP